MSVTTSTQPGGPLQPQLTWHGKIARVTLIAAISLVILTLFFHVDPLGFIGVHIWEKVHPAPTATPLVQATGNPVDSVLNAAVQEITGGASRRAAPTPAPTSTSNAAPGVVNAAAQAGLTAQQQAELALATQYANQVGGTTTSDNAFNNFGSQIERQEKLALATPTPQPPVATAPPVPSLVTPMPKPQPLLAPTNAPAMVGVAPGQQYGALPVSVEQLQRAEQSSFIQNETTSPYTEAELSPARSVNEIWPGDPIHCILKTTIDSSLPGQAVCVVTHDVKSHLAPYRILIPATSEMWGSYNAQVEQGQTRMQIRWDMLVLPNGATLALQSVQANDSEGRAGIEADVNNHVGRVYTTSLIGTLLSVASGLVAARAATAAIPSVAQLFGLSANNQVQNIASEKIAASANVPPVLTVHSGTTFTVSFAAIQPMPPYDSIAQSYGAKQ